MAPTTHSACTHRRRGGLTYRSTLGPSALSVPVNPCYPWERGPASRDFNTLGGGRGEGGVKEIKGTACAYAAAVPPPNQSASLAARLPTDHTDTTHTRDRDARQHKTTRAATLTSGAGGKHPYSRDSKAQSENAHEENAQGRGGSGT